MKLHTFTVTIKAPDEFPYQMLERYVREAVCEWRRSFSMDDKIFSLQSKNIRVRRSSVHPIKEREHD